MLSLDLGNLLVHLRLGKGEWDKALREVENTVDRAARKLDSFGRQMTMKVSVPLIAVGTAGVKAFASFDDAMTKSLAIMDQVTPKMRQQMESVAVGLSKKTTSSATTLAGGYKILASAGYDAAQSIKALGPVNQFAIAGNFDLAKSVNYVVGSMGALNMKIKDPIENMKNMIRISDLLVGVNIISQAETEQFAAALSNEAASAIRNFNLDLEEGIAVLGAYADQNIKAEEAGSLFSRMIRLMIQGFQNNREAWQAMNMTIYDTKGELKPLADIVEMLTNKFGGMSTEAKALALDMIGFEARSQQAILPILGMQDVIREYTRRLKHMGGITNEVANKNIASFSAQMKILWNNTTSVGREIGERLAPTILKVNECIKAGIVYWESLSDATKDHIVQFGLIAAAIGPVAIGLGKLTGLFGSVLGSLTALISPTGLVVAGLLTIGVAVYALSAMWRANFGDIQGMTKRFVENLKDLWRQLQDNVVAQFLKWLVQGHINAFKYIRANAVEFFADMVGLTQGSIAWIKAMKSGVSEAWTAVDFESMFVRFRDGWKQANKDWAAGFVAGVDQVEDGVGKMKAFTVDAFKDFTVTVGVLGEATAQTFGEIWDLTMAQAKADFSSLSSWISSELKQALGGTSGERGIFASVLDATVPKVKEFVNVMTQPFRELKHQLTQASDAAALTAAQLEAMKNSAVMSEEAIRAAWDKMYSGLDRRSDRYFTFQQKRLDADIELWMNNAVAFQVEKQYVLDLIEAYKKEQQVLLDIERLKSSDNVFKGFVAGLKAMDKGLETAGQLGHDLAFALRDGVVGALADALMRVKSLNDGLREVARSMARMGFEWGMKQLFSIGMSAVSGAVGGVFGSKTPIGVEKTNWGASALGNVFSKGRLVPFGLGGVFDLITRPTVFPMAGGNMGLAGERGAEAIVPLKRDSAGRLGVLSNTNGNMAGLLGQILNAVKADRGMQLVLIDDRNDVDTYLNSPAGQRRIVRIARKHRSQING